MSIEAVNRSPRKRWLACRRIVQIGFLLAFIAPVIAAGWGLFGLTQGGDDRMATPAEMPLFGTLSSSDVLGVNLLDPFAALEITAASKSFAFDWLLFALPVLVVYALVRGRAFCGWICPVNLLLEGIDWLRKKLGIQVAERTVPRHAKLWVALGVITLSLITSIPVFEAFSPISAVNKGILLGSLAGIWTLVGIVVLELFWSHRVWCRSLCPVGGFYESIGRIGLVNVRIDHEACIHCDACKHACLADPEILDPALSEQEDFVRAGDCMACGNCIDSCPTKALSLHVGLDHYRKA
ncbi:NapH/MauN family ferredoxin-type protein [Raoultibacter phocaeensis]|uniref:NapH/MauN family ferredoxin-type protein n=1 Tax=Raoultibacter phocaeensis TaxID=2479841 RepID=UPI0011192B65|nr:NapH/MauN family ferredoxin-type protein [Raoultibacter phocaeensis]